MRARRALVKRQKLDSVRPKEVGRLRVGECVRCMEGKGRVRPRVVNYSAHEWIRSKVAYKTIEKILGVQGYEDIHEPIRCVVKLACRTIENFKDESSAWESARRQRRVNWRGIDRGQDRVCSRWRTRSRHRASSCRGERKEWSWRWSSSAVLDRSP